MAKVCFVSYDILGPIRNGGIGTAMTSAAEMLASEGHDVTILYPTSHTEQKSLSYWTLAFERQSIKFRSLFSEENPLANSYLIYQWLKIRRFDVIHFHDWRGPGYWSSVAKRQKLAFEDTTIVCQVHGQTYWHLSSSSEFIESLSDLEIDFMEQRAVELADVIFSPSNYMLEWMRERGWILPSNIFVSPNLLPANFNFCETNGSLYKPGTLVPIEEIVFFGRLEARKGIELFCEAVTKALSAGARIKRVTFLGKEGMCGPEPATAIISRAAANWPVPYSIINDRDIFSAHQYLAGHGRLAVIASVIENSPYTVLETLALGLPFLSADVGGTAELVHPDDRTEVLFDRDARVLALCLANCTERGARIARPSITVEAVRQSWSNWHRQLLSTNKVASMHRSDDRKPLISICMSHFSRPNLLRIAIESIEAQTYPNIELILLDDASPDEPTDRYLAEIKPRFEKKGWRIIRNKEEVWTGRARNLAVSHSSGDYILLMDDDNVARPNEVDTFVKAAIATNADVLTCHQQPFVGTGRPPPEQAEVPIGWMASGPNLSYALFKNCLGDLNMMVKRSVWDKIGGFTTDRYGCEDWEFLVAAILGGYKLEVVPEMLFYYRHSDAGLGYRYDAQALYKSNIRPLRPALRTIRPDLRMALKFSVERQHNEIRRNLEGYWNRPGGLDSSSVKIRKMPLNTGEALAEMAKVAVLRGQDSSALLLYKQAFKNVLSKEALPIDSNMPSAENVGSEIILEFLQDAAFVVDDVLLPSIIRYMHLLYERGVHERLHDILGPLLRRHPENYALREMNIAIKNLRAEAVSELDAGSKESLQVGSDVRPSHHG